MSYREPPGPGRPLPEPIRVDLQEAIERIIAARLANYEPEGADLVHVATEDEGFGGLIAQLWLVLARQDTPPRFAQHLRLQDGLEFGVLAGRFCEGLRAHFPEGIPPEASRTLVLDIAVLLADALETMRALLMHTLG